MEEYQIKEYMFKEHSKYYRNALVRSNYSDFAKKVDTNFSFLEKFYGNLLFGEKYVLRNDDMVVGIK